MCTIFPHTFNWQLATGNWQLATDYWQLTTGATMRLGYACLNVTLGRKMRGLRLKTLRERGIAYLQSLVDENLALTADILRWNRAHDIGMFRLSSDIVPFGSHEEVDLALLDFSLARDIPSLAEGMRLSLHHSHQAKK